MTRQHYAGYGERGRRKQKSGTVMTRVEELKNALLALPISERIELAEHLAESLLATEQEQLAWAAELDRRLDLYDRGDSVGIPVEQFLLGMEAKQIATRQAAGS